MNTLDKLEAIQSSMSDHDKAILEVVLLAAYGAAVGGNLEALGAVVYEYATKRREHLNNLIGK